MKKKNHHTVGNYRSRDGMDLFYQVWKPVQEPSAVLVFIHGMAEHSDRYLYPVSYFVERGYAIYAMDLRGHGRSEGRRAYAESLNHFLDDIHDFLEKVKKEEPNRKVFLIGHSFGGQLVLNYGARSPKGLEGIIASSPNIKLKFRVSLIKRLLIPFLSKLFPILSVGNELDPSLVSKNQEVVESYRNDQNVLRRITMRLGDIMLENQLRLMELANDFRIPCLLMHAGDDQICSPEGTEEFFQKIPIHDKTLKIYKGFYHELFNEPDREMVFKDMETWVSRRLE